MPRPEELRLKEEAYATSVGEERFLSWEHEGTDALAGFLRLLLPSEGVPEWPPIIRELKVLGAETPVGSPAQRSAAFQHRGLGSALVDRAEEIARASGAARLRVISAVGTRGYYARLGYARDGPWMAKPLLER